MRKNQIGIGSAVDAANRKKMPILTKNKCQQPVESREIHMKRYCKELTLCTLQLFLFYIFPLFAGPADAMGMVLLLIMATLLLAFLLGFLSGRKIKYLYPVAVSVVFLPSVFLYYNVSAWIHCLWYLVIAAIGLLLGSGIRAMFSKIVSQD